MAIGTVLLAEETILEVASTLVGTYSPISDINSASRPSSRQTSSYPVLMRATAHTIPGAREVSLTLNGYLSKGDTGQDMLRSAEAAGTTVFVRILPDGTNGETREYRVGSREWSTGAEGLQEVSFELSSAGDPTVVGAGLTF